MNSSNDVTPPYADLVEPSETTQLRSPTTSNYQNTPQEIDALIEAALAFDGLIQIIESGMGILSYGTEAATYNEVREVFGRAVAPFVVYPAPLDEEGANELPTV